MPEMDLTLLYVSDPGRSIAFYTDLLDRQPVESSPNFAMFAMEKGVGLGLWARDRVKPGVTAPAGGSEIVFQVADAKAVRAMHDDWSRRGLAIAQEPTEMDFGHTFVALDPDGHRLRVFAPLM